jgi:hypothetical protein
VHTGRMVEKSSCVFLGIQGLWHVVDLGVSPVDGFYDRAENCELLLSYDLSVGKLLHVGWTSSLRELSPVISSNAPHYRAAAQAGGSQQPTS